MSVQCLLPCHGNTRDATYWEPGFYGPITASDFHRSLMYSHTFQQHAYYPSNPDGHGKLQQQGVAWSGFFEGFASLNLAMADDDNVGDAYRFWYDRHVGTASTQRTSDAERFDHDRAGTVWSLLFYDESGNSANPQSIWGLALRFLMTMAMHSGAIAGRTPMIFRLVFTETPTDTAMPGTKVKRGPDHHGLQHTLFRWAEYQS